MDAFGVTALTSCGFFWISLVLLSLPKRGLATAPSATVMGFYLSIWGVCNLFMFVLLFFILVTSDFALNELLRKIAGCEGIVCGASAICLAMAEVINEQFGCTVLSMGEPE